MAESDANIVQIIQEMIKEGENEQAILQSLQELGVPREKAKKLLLVGQADVYAVLQAEINRLLEKKLLEQKQEIIRHLQADLQVAEDATAQKVRDQNSQEVKEYQKFLENRFMILESQVNQSAQRSLETSDRVRDKLLADESRLRKIELEGGAPPEAQPVVHKTANIILAFLGILFALSTAYIFYSYLQAGVSTESLIVGVVLGLISVTILFISTLF